MMMCPILSDRLTSPCPWCDVRCIPSPTETRKNSICAGSVKIHPITRIIIKRKLTWIIVWLISTSTLINGFTASLNESHAFMESDIKWTSLTISPSIWVKTPMQIIFSFSEKKKKKTHCTLLTFRHCWQMNVSASRGENKLNFKGCFQCCT